MKNILAPSILAADFNHLGKQIAEVREGGAPYLHFDVMDGIFVPSISFGMPVMKSIRKNTDLFFDTHLMIEKPGRYIETFAENGADGITFHIEAAPDDAGDIIRKIKETKALTGKNLRAGISVKPNTPISAILPYAAEADMILVMTVEPGFGGQKLIPETVDKVRALRAFIDAEGLDTDIEVDGGITADNIAEINKAGANVIVAGSAVFNDDPLGSTKKLLSLIGA
ncbi:MAG: ribulose-phosphate 3-epimerase [Lachnospiraceae bacterium]|nr:ribulose-phosphate 3-epimerase [Lachnospiraceae bacterium]